MVSKLSSSQNGLGLFSNEVAFQSSFGTLEQKPANIINSDDLNNLVSEIDKQMKDAEARIVGHLQAQIDDNNFGLTNKVEAAEHRIRAIEQNELRAQQSSRKSKIIEASTISNGSMLDPVRMESALNAWLSKVEEQVNTIEDQVQGKAHQIDLKSLEQRFFNDETEKSTKIRQLEQFCKRITDDIVELKD